MLSFDTAVAFAGFTAEDEDLVRVSDSSFSLFFDGSAAGVAPGLDLDAAERLSNGHLLLSFDGSGSLGGVSFDDEDVLEHDPDAGTWELAYNGSAERTLVGGANLDAVSPGCRSPTRCCCWSRGWRPSSRSATAGSGAEAGTPAPPAAPRLGEPHVAERPPEMRAAGGPAARPQFKRSHYAGWLDEALPGLGGESLREAARSSRAGRGAVDVLLKETENLEQRSPGRALRLRASADPLDSPAHRERDHRT